MFISPQNLPKKLVYKTCKYTAVIYGSSWHAQYKTQSSASISRWDTFSWHSWDDVHLTKTLWNMVPPRKEPFSQCYCILIFMAYLSTCLHTECGEHYPFSWYYRKCLDDHLMISQKENRDMCRPNYNTTWTFNSNINDLMVTVFTVYV